MKEKKILFLIGSPNQTQQMHQISNYLRGEYDCWFSQVFPDLLLTKWVVDSGMVESMVVSGSFKAKADQYLRDHSLQNDYMAKKNKYDLIVFCSDIMMPKKLLGTKTVWVQEGMTDVLTGVGKVVKALKLPGYFAMNTALNGTSDICDIYCAASDGYKERFSTMGTDRRKIVVTGIPNFDNVAQYMENDFEHRDHVLVATSDIRECFRRDDRINFLRKCKSIAEGRKLIFKLHPNEKKGRAITEIKQVIGEDTLVYTDGNPNHMIANCEELITQYSTLAYVGIALGKKVYSYYDVNELNRLVPVQNGGTSARNIADVCRGYIEYEGSGTDYLGHREMMPLRIVA